MSSSTSRRTLRSTPKDPLSSSSSTPASSNILIPPITFTSSSTSPSNPITFYPPNSTLPSITKSSLLLLRQKQAKLQSTAQVTLSSLPSPAHTNALLSTLIFAQAEAGTAVIISPSGDVLTCSHCFGDTLQEYQALKSKKKWMLFYDGTAVLVSCVVWDGRRDLALCKIIGVEYAFPSLTPPNTTPPSPTFTSLPVTNNIIPLKAELLCIGQPGADDLESSTLNKKTKYNLFAISQGTYRGIIKGADPQVNEELGTLKHDCWTYWGHSGAPLVLVDGGELVGVHSSWDDQSGMRHGVPGVAIKEFLKECGIIPEEREDREDELSET